jgi:hypothetical protein
MRSIWAIISIMFALACFAILLVSVLSWVSEEGLSLALSDLGQWPSVAILAGWFAAGAAFMGLGVGLLFSRRST